MALDLTKMRPSQYGRGRQTDARIGIGGGRTQFALDVRAWCDRQKANLDIVVRKITLEAFRRVVMRSPVDTGRFRGNWQPTVGTIATSSLITEDKSGAATVANIAAFVESVKRGDVIYLTNNLAYARRLEYGWSSQAPEGMVGRTAAEFQQVINASVGGQL